VDAAVARRERPTQPDNLGDSRPILLWLWGVRPNLRYACLESASVGRGAPTGYGADVANVMAAALAVPGWVAASEDCHGPFCGSPGVRFLRATRRHSPGPRAGGLRNHL
jgi:hypothetical protein